MTAFSMMAVFASCQQENLETENLEPGTVQVVVTMGEQTKGFTDLEGITWEAGDKLKYAGGLEVSSEPLAAENISSDGYTATFTFPASLIEVDRTGWFVSSKCHPGNYTEVEFTLGNGEGNVYTQDVAGAMNTRYLFLHSGTGLINITKDQAPELSMAIAGTVFRLIPYTSKYNNEKVLSAKMVSNTNLVGTVAYDRGAGTYRGVNDINWQAKNLVKVDLGEPFALEGVTSADASKGIYMAVAATKADLPLNGYQYVIETDKATYTFDAMDKQLVVGENVVKNVMLNLDKAVRVSEGGVLQYVGDLALASNNPLSAYGVNDFDGGYWYAQVKADGTDAWVNKDGADNTHFYSAVEFAVTDLQTGADVDWLKVKYGGAGGTHWLLTATENTGAERSAVITATFPDVKGYVVTDECKTKTITVTQSAAGGARIVTYGSTSLPGALTLNASACTDKNIGYSLLIVEGAEDRNWAGIYSGVTFKCVSEADAAAENYTNEVDWLSCRYATNAGGIFDCVWWLTAAANTGSELRTAVIVALFPDDDAYAFPAPQKVTVTQMPENDKTIYDPASSANMWNSKTKAELSCYYAPNWGQIADPAVDVTGNTMTISLPAATFAQWQAQVGFLTDLTTSAAKTYDFYCVLNSSKNHPGVTIKLHQNGDDNLFYFADVHPLQAGVDYVYKVPMMPGKDISAVKLLFDFGGNEAETVVTVKDIIIQEHQE